MQKWHKFILPLITGCGIVATASAGAQDLLQRHSEERIPRTSDALEQMVRQDCGSCHGLTFNGGLGSPLRPGNLEKYSLEDLQTIILDGLPGTAMPPWRAIVTENEAIWMARYLKSGGSD